MVDATDLETTATYEGCGQVTRQRKLTDKHGKVRAIEGTVYGWKPMVWYIYRRLSGESCPTGGSMLARIRAQVAAASMSASMRPMRWMPEAIMLDAVREAQRRRSCWKMTRPHGRGPCCLFYGDTVAGRPLHLVCTTTRPRLLLITVYEP